MIELLYGRRSVRKYKPETVEENKVDILKQALLLSPSGMNKKAWRFIIIKDKKLIEKAASAKAHGTVPLQTAPLAVVVIGLTDKSDMWVEDCSIASTIVQLTAESVGLKSCWIQIRKRLREDGSESAAWLADLLKLSENETVESIIALGYGDESPQAYTREDLDFSKITEM